MMARNLPVRYLVNKSLWSSCFMTVIILSMALPVAGPSETRGGIAVSPITGISHSGTRASGVGEWDGGFVDGRS